MVVQLHERFRDVSDFREVPDHQEVFQDPDADQSVIFEVLEYLEEKSDAEIAIHHWHQLGEDNEASEMHEVVGQAISAEQMEAFAKPQDARVVLCVGDQSVAKDNDAVSNRIRLACIVIRLPQNTTDILISVNTPFQMHQQSSAKHAMESLFFGDGSNIALQQVISTFNIVDYGLFC